MNEAVIVDPKIKVAGQTYQLFAQVAEGFQSDVLKYKNWFNHKQDEINQVNQKQVY